MDLSKLPRMSDTQKQQQLQQPQAQPPPEQTPPPSHIDSMPRSHARAESAPGPEMFINIIIGLLLIYLGWQVFDYLIHLMTGRPFNYPVTDSAGNPIPYTQSVFFPINLGVALFGVSLVLYGLLARSEVAAAAWLVLVLMVAAALVNVYAVITSLNLIGLQILPALSAAFAIYLGMYQWARVKARFSTATTPRA